jgi:hypothetical protein
MKYGERQEWYAFDEIKSNSLGTLGAGVDGEGFEFY